MCKEIGTERIISYMNIIFTELISSHKQLVLVATPVSTGVFFLCYVL